MTASIWTCLTRWYMWSTTLQPHPSIHCEGIQHIINTKHMMCQDKSTQLYQPFLYCRFKEVKILLHLISLLKPAAPTCYPTPSHAPHQHSCSPYHLHGLMQEGRNSIANALELCLSCTNPSIRPPFYILTLVILPTPARASLSIYRERDSHYKHN